MESGSQAESRIYLTVSHFARHNRTHREHPQRFVVVRFGFRQDVNRTRPGERVPEIFVRPATFQTLLNFLADDVIDVFHEREGGYVGHLISSGLDS